MITVVYLKNILDRLFIKEKTLDHIIILVSLAQYFEFMMKYSGKSFAVLLPYMRSKSASTFFELKEVSIAENKVWYRKLIYELEISKFHTWIQNSSSAVCPCQLVFINDMITGWSFFHLQMSYMTKINYEYNFAPIRALNH